MSVFIGSKNKRVELAERKDAINPNLFTGSKDFTGNWLNVDSVKQKDKYLDFTAVYVDWQWDGISQYIDANKGETFTFSTYIKAKAGSSICWYTTLNSDNEDGHTEADAGGDGVSITTTGDWQRVSTTFTVTSDGTIKPRIESDGTTPFWIAGMKLEHGAVATDWCPALEDIAWTSDITNLQNTVNNIDSTHTPIVAGASGDDLFAFKTSQIRLYGGDGTVGKTCKNLPPASNTQWFTVQYIFEGPNYDGIAIYRSPASEIWINGCNGASYGSWVRVANATDITNLQNQIQADKTANKTDVTNLQSKVDSAVTKLQGQITEIQSKNYIEGYNCANESDAETYSKAHPNTLVTVS